MKKIVLIGFIIFISLVILSLLMTLFSREVVHREKVALVRIEGPIFDSKDTIEELKKYRDDPSIKAIVMRVDSPGGAVAPAQEIYEEVKKTKDKKPVIVSMGSISASGGYYISAPATKILANPGTLTGSIGVIMEIPNIKGLMDKIGIKTVVIKSGRHKDIASIFKEMSLEQREIIQRVLDDVHEQFINAVAQGRNLSVEDVRKIADGRIFTGSQAMQLKLIDSLGNLEDAIKEAGRLAGIRGEPEVVTKEERIGLRSLLKGEFPRKIMEEYSTIKIKYMFIP